MANCTTSQAIIKETGISDSQPDHFAILRLVESAVSVDASIFNSDAGKEVFHDS